MGKKRAATHSQGGSLRQTVSSNAVAQARRSRAQRSPTAPPHTIGKGPHVTKAVRGAGD